MTFRMSGNQACRQAQVKLDVFSVSGALMYEQRFAGEVLGFTDDVMTWDLRQRGGARVVPGVYIFRVTWRMNLASPHNTATNSSLSDLTDLARRRNFATRYHEEHRFYCPCSGPCVHVEPQSRLGPNRGGGSHAIASAQHHHHCGAFLDDCARLQVGCHGDVGVALSPDANSMHWNPAKMAFAPNEVEMSLSYAPWLRALVDDMNLAYVSSVRRLNKRQAFGVALRYFSLGNITFTDEVGTTIRDFKPAELSLDGGFSQKFTERFSGGFSARFIHSNLTGARPCKVRRAAQAFRWLLTSACSM